MQPRCNLTYCRCSLSVVLKEQVLSNSPHLLQSIVPLEKKEEEEEKKAGAAILQNASSCTDEAPEGQGSLSEGPFRDADTKNKQRSHERDTKQQHHSFPDTRNDDNMNYKQRRFMIYLCGGYKGNVHVDYLLHFSFFI